MRYRRKNQNKGERGAITMRALLFALAIAMLVPDVALLPR
jgi:hypothetical protein